mmetsp:Transcript_1116/g.2679  ORF Transcript_1116/g.2679 Transcript_1116/m.2679 type:complete len:100 (+) Transcript_1116:379-678(+)
MFTFQLRARIARLRHQRWAFAAPLAVSRTGFTISGGGTCEVLSSSSELNYGGGVNKGSSWTHDYNFFLYNLLVKPGTLRVSMQLLRGTLECAWSRFLAG